MNSWLTQSGYVFSLNSNMHNVLVQSKSLITGQLDMWSIVSKSKDKDIFSKKFYVIKIQYFLESILDIPGACGGVCSVESVFSLCFLIFSLVWLFHYCWSLSSASPGLQDWTHWKIEQDQFVRLSLFSALCLPTKDTNLCVLLWLSKDLTNVSICWPMKEA